MKRLKELSQIFGFKIPVDGLLTAKFGYPCIDIIALDKKLRSRYPNDNNDSMQNLIIKQFGEDANSLLDNIIQNTDGNKILSDL